MAEELFFEESLRDRPAVDLGEVLPFSPPRVVESLGDKLLSRAASPVMGTVVSTSFSLDQREYVLIAGLGMMPLYSYLPAGRGVTGPARWLAVLERLFYHHHKPSVFRGFVM